MPPLLSPDCSPARARLGRRRLATQADYRRMALRFVSGDAAFDVVVHQGRLSPDVTLAIVTVLDPSTGQCLAEAVAPAPASWSARVRIHSDRVSLDLALRGARADGWLQIRGRRFEGGGPAWIERLHSLPIA